MTGEQRRRIRMVERIVGTKGAVQWAMGHTDGTVVHYEDHSRRLPRAFLVQPRFGVLFALLPRYEANTGTMYALAIYKLDYVIPFEVEEFVEGLLARIVSKGKYRLDRMGVEQLEKQTEAEFMARFREDLEGVMGVRRTYATLGVCLDIVRKCMEHLTEHIPF